MARHSNLAVAADAVQALRNAYHTLLVNKAQDLGTTQEARAQATATGRLRDAPRHAQGTPGVLRATSAGGPALKVARVQADSQPIAGFAR